MYHAIQMQPKPDEVRAFWYVHVYVRVCMYISTCVYGANVKCLPLLLSTLFFEVCSLTELGAYQSNNPSKLPSPAEIYLPLPTSQHWDYRCICPPFYVGARDLNSDPMFTASTLLTTISPAPVQGLG